MTDTHARTHAETAARPSKLHGFRQRKDRFFAEHEHSPLEPHQRERFAGLEYFPEDPDLVYVLDLDTSGPDVGERVVLAATDGQPREFVKAGRIHFAVKGQPVTFLVYREPDRGRYYLPFRDGTAGVETYAVGRYIDPQDRPDGKLVVDFNYAYNPYCAYSWGWSCPIPPAENVTPVRIEAGEKAFPEDTKPGLSFRLGRS